MSISFDDRKGIEAAGPVFSWLVRLSRQTLGRSVEEVARLAGMTVSDWQAIEDGRIPSRAQLRSIAKAIDLRIEQLAIIDRIRRKA